MGFVILRHPDSGALVSAPQGFSFTTFLFGSLVPLFRVWPLGFILMLVLGFSTSFFTAHILGGLFLNWIYTQFLFWKGFLPTSDHDFDRLWARGLRASGVFDKNQNHTIYVNQESRFQRHNPFGKGRTFASSFMRKSKKR